MISTNEEQPAVDLVRERRRPPRRLDHNLPGAAAPRLAVRVYGSRDRGGALKRDREVDLETCDRSEHGRKVRARDGRSPLARRFCGCFT